MGGGMGGYSLGLVRRQVAPQSELLPGGVLSTDENPANVVRARLANGADLYVGPSSEVKLLKPTEVRLQSGQLVLIVPAGDQVDLLGPETAVLSEPENNRLYNRRGQGQLKAYESRRQVTGRATYRIENRLLQQMEQEPAWLTTYNAKLNSSKANPPSPVKQPAPSAKDAPGLQKARAPEPAASASPK